VIALALAAGFVAYIAFGGRGGRRRGCRRPKDEIGDACAPRAARTSRRSRRKLRATKSKRRRRRPSSKNPR
jgi:hypothetical protein